MPQFVIFHQNTHLLYAVQGKLVYANQGKVSDYEELNRTLGNLTGTIAIVKYGGAGRADKVSKPQNSTMHHVHVITKQAFSHENLAYLESSASCSLQHTQPYNGPQMDSVCRTDR